MTPEDIIKRHMHLMTEYDMTEKQKSEVIFIVWRIMEQFADRAFGIETKGESNPIIDKFLEDRKWPRKSSKKLSKGRTVGKQQPS